MKLSDFKSQIKTLKKENTITNIKGDDNIDYGNLLDGILTWLKTYGDVQLQNLSTDNKNVSITILGTNKNSLKDYLVKGYTNHNATWDNNNSILKMSLNPISKDNATTNTTTIDPSIPNVYDTIAKSIFPVNEEKLFENINRIKQLF
jgi:hypothetical protein